MILKLIFYGICVSWILFIWSRRKFYILSTKIRGPLGYPLIGVGLEFIHQENILDFMLKSRNKYGSIFVTYLGFTPVLVVSDPKTCEKLLTSTAFVNKSFVYKGVKRAIGDGLFTSDNPRWSHHRKLLNPTFNHKILISFFPIFNKEVKVLINKLSKYVGKAPIDLPFMLQQCTLDTTCQTTMGKVMNFQSGENEDFLNSFNDILKYITQQIFIPWYASDFLFQFAVIKKQFEECAKRCTDMVGDVIQEKVKKVNLMKDNNIDHTSNKDDEFNITKSRNIFLDQAFQLMKTNDFTKYDVQTQSNTMIAAAFESTADVMFITLMCLAMFPIYQDRVFDEIVSIFPDKDIDITYAETQQMVYLEMVINESMRLLAPVPLIARKCTEDFDFGNGIIIPKGTQLGVDIFNMQRCENIWGPKAKTFDPDHFLKDNFSRMHPYSFMPFTKGLRNCIGWRYGMMALKVFLAQILRSYRFTTDFKYEDLKFIEDISLKFVETPLLELHERNI